MYMWRAVDSEGEVLDVLVQPRRDKAAALKLVKKLLKRQGFAPTVIVTDKLGSYRAALQVIGFSGQHEQGLRRPLSLQLADCDDRLRCSGQNGEGLTVDFEHRQGAERRVRLAPLPVGGRHAIVLERDPAHRQGQSRRLSASPVKVEVSQFQLGHEAGSI